VRRLFRGPRTLRGRVSLLALGVIAVWLTVLTVGFNLYLERRVHTQSDAALRVRAQAASATVALTSSGAVRVRESSTDSDLDSDTWIYADGRALERPPAPGRELQRFADSLADNPEGFADLEDDARLYVLPATSAGRRVATVIVAKSTAGERRAEVAALGGSVIVSALLLAVAYPAVRVAVQRALQPVDAMARQAADWSAHETSRRFGTGQRYEELRDLAADLDGLLDRLSAALRHERRLSGELSHELRTPLAHIAAEADLLVRSGHPDDRDAHLAIADTARSMDRIIDTLLAAARAETDAASGTCRVGAVLDALDDRGFVRTGPADLAVGVDAAVLERILAPLIDNAERHARSTVRVDLRRENSTVHIDVVDDGAGVSAEDAPRLFEPGYRATPHDGHGGAGLGLALSRRLARGVDGDVRLVPGGEGATFRVSLPAG
jgi:signal transduction histidine kinase